MFKCRSARGLLVGASLVEADRIDTTGQLEALVRLITPFTLHVGVAMCLMASYDSCFGVD